MQNYAKIGLAPNYLKRISYIQFCDGRKQSIKTYLLHLLPNFPNGLSCRDISGLSGIEVQSLTCPLKELIKTNLLAYVGFKRQDETNRLVNLYSTISPSKENADV